MGNYDDIINLKRPISKHPKMSLYQRSAQFAPFAALTGYEGQVKETARLTDKRIELDEEIKVMLDMKIQVIQEMLSNNPALEITYFIPDNVKLSSKSIINFGIGANVPQLKHLKFPAHFPLNMRCPLFFDIFFTES